MALKPVIDTVEGISKDIAAEYTQGADGKFYLSVEGVDSVVALTSTLDRLKGERTELKTKLAEYQGIDLDEVKTLKAEVEQLRKSKGEGLDEKQRRQLVETYETRIAELEKGLKDRESKLVSYTLDSTFTGPLSKAEPVYPDVVMRLAREQCRVEEVNGKHVVRVIDAEGDVRISPRGDPMTPDDLLMEMKTKTYPGLFKGGNPGAGSTTAGPGNTKLTPAQQLAAQRKAMLGG